MQSKISVIYCDDHAGKRSEFGSLVAAHFHLVHHMRGIVYSRGDGIAFLPYLEELERTGSIDVWQIVKGCTKQIARIEPAQQEVTA